MASFLYRLLHPTTIVLHPDFESISSFFCTIPERFERGEGTVIYKGRNELRTMTYGGQTFVVKSFHKPNIINKFVYGTFRKSKAERSYDHARYLRAIEIGTPRPVGYINIRKGILFDRSYYVTLKSECTHLYQDLFTQHFDYADEVLRAIGHVTAALHESGCSHKDYGRANIMFQNVNGKIKIDLVDLNRMRFGDLDLKQGCKNFDRLPATPHMHRLMAETYAADRGFDADECFRLMEAYRSTQPGKIDNKY